MGRKRIPQIVIGAAGSGSGKTTLTMGLLRALRDRGLRVQPFKCGPDYIDTKYHALASGYESVNLDSWLASAEHLKGLYARYGRCADVLITEGAMGLFDGYNEMRGSSAEIARLLQVPVLLVVNAKAMAYSVAPLLYGFKHFCREVNVAGVVFNQVASESHYRALRKACDDAGVPCLGYLPRMKELELPSRHLGLTLENGYLIDSFSLKVAEAVERYIEVDRLLELFSTPFEEETAVPSVEKKGTLRVAVAHDEAFNFVYRENMERLRELGELQLFSPMADGELPDADFVYLPGGYPEFFLQQLSANRTMLESVRSYVVNGGRMLAECGGMMYLCKAIVGMDGKRYPMAGALPLTATMENMRLHLGYRCFTYRGHTYKGHEFHYSSVTEGDGLSSVVQQFNARGEKVDTPLYNY